MPDTGTLLHVKTPKESDYVRLETGFEAGDEISVSLSQHQVLRYFFINARDSRQVFYDPLIAKLIVHGPNRREALKRLTKALGEYQIVGPSTNLEFLSRLAANEAFADEDLDTGFIPVRFLSPRLIYRRFFAESANIQHGRHSAITTPCSRLFLHPLPRLSLLQHFSFRIEKSRTSLPSTRRPLGHLLDLQASV